MSRQCGTECKRTVRCMYVMKHVVHNACPIILGTDISTLIVVKMELQENCRITVLQFAMVPLFPPPPPPRDRSNIPRYPLEVR